MPARFFSVNETYVRFCMMDALLCMFMIVVPIGNKTPSVNGAAPLIDGHFLKNLINQHAHAY